MRASCSLVLLAGGMLSSVNASIDQMEEGKYYIIKVGNQGNTQESDLKYALDGDKSSSDWLTLITEIPTDFDGSAWWTVEKVKDPVTDAVIAYKLKNKKGQYYEVKQGDKTYNAFVQPTPQGSNPTGWAWALKTIISFFRAQHLEFGQQSRLSLITSATLIGI